MFFICSIKSPQCTDKYSKKIFDSDFPFPCFDVPKASNFTSGGVQNRKTKKKETGNDYNFIQDSKLLSDILLVSYKQRTIVPSLANWLARYK